MTDVVRALRERARDAFRNGHFDEADSLSREAANAGLAAAERARRIQQQAEQAATEPALDAAEDIATRGEVALTRLDYHGAAAQFAEAASVVPATQSEARDRLLLRQAAALHDAGEMRGDPADLRRAVTLLQDVLPRRPRGARPEDWADLQNRLGIVLRVIGERGDDAALRRAVATYEAALDVFRGLDVPAYLALVDRNLMRARALLAAR